MASEHKSKLHILQGIEMGGWIREVLKLYKRAPSRLF